MSKSRRTCVWVFSSPLAARDIEGAIMPALLELDYTAVHEMEDGSGWKGLGFEGIGGEYPHSEMGIKVFLDRRGAGRHELRAEFDPEVHPDFPDRIRREVLPAVKAEDIGAEAEPGDEAVGPKASAAGAAAKRGKGDWIEGTGDPGLLLHDPSPTGLLRFESNLDLLLNVCRVAVMYKKALDGLEGGLKFDYELQEEEDGWVRVGVGGFFVLVCDPARVPIARFARALERERARHNVVAAGSGSQELQPYFIGSGRGLPGGRFVSFFYEGALHYFSDFVLWPRFRGELRGALDYAAGLAEGLDPMELLSGEPLIAGLLERSDGEARQRIVGMVSSMMARSLPLKAKRLDEAWASFDAAPGGSGGGEASLPAAEAGARLAKGLEASRAGRLEEALARFDEGLALAPKHADLRKQKAILLRTMGRLEESVDWCSRALELMPRDYLLWWNKGFCLHRLGRPREAIEAWDHALDENPRDADLWFNEGVAFVDLGRRDDAIRCFERTLELNPADGEARRALERARGN